METSIINKIRKRTDRFVESQLLKIGRVLDVRIWETGNIIEVDLHLPMANINRWTRVPFIKFRVSELCFQDYTPFGWDDETSTCSILIDTSDSSAGRRWANSLRTGDQIYYLKIEFQAQPPHLTDMVVGLGDASSLGYLLALQYLTLPGSRFDGAVLLNSPGAGQLFKDYFDSPVTILTNYNEMAGWLMTEGFCTTHTSFYLSGNHGLVKPLHKVLKTLGHTKVQISDSGFNSSKF